MAESARPVDPAAPPVPPTPADVPLESGSMWADVLAESSVESGLLLALNAEPPVPLNESELPDFDVDLLPQAVNASAAHKCTIANLFFMVLLYGLLPLFDVSGVLLPVP